MKNCKYIFIVTGLLFTIISCNKEATTFSNVQSSSVDINNSSSQYFIGEHFGGGIIFYIDATGKHGLIALSADLEEPLFWSKKYILTGAKDTTLGSGLANTNKIVKKLGFPQFEADTYAALECLELNQNGYQDWYLPSINELNVLYKNKAIVGGFQPFAYWSSSEWGTKKAWFKNFSNGTQVIQLKTAQYALRPIRKF